MQSIDVYKKALLKKKKKNIYFKIVYFYHDYKFKFINRNEQMNIQSL